MTDWLRVAADELAGHPPCDNCHLPMAAHCTFCFIPCCPGKCPSSWYASRYAEGDLITITRPDHPPCTVLVTKVDPHDDWSVTLTTEPAESSGSPE